MKKAFENIFVKIGVIFVLVTILVVPAVMIEGLIAERKARHSEAVSEISSKHAESQVVTGPILSIPFEKHKRSATGEVLNAIESKGVFHVLPELLTVKGDITPEKRKRGIYDVAVYGSDLRISGNYSNIDLDGASLTVEDLQLKKAYITLGLSDLKGVHNQVEIGLGKEKYLCEPGVVSDDIVQSGLHVNTPLTDLTGAIPFDFELNLDGTEYLRFIPVGKETRVTLASSWKDPSFNGDFLPESRKVSKDGFEASWKILNLNRNFPQSWKDRQYAVNDAQFGVDLNMGVDVYQKSMRVAKYSILFIALTFLVFFFVEVTNRILIHPIQYALVGVALILFFVLVLAFSEQIGFNLAYGIAASMTIALVTMYSRTIIKSWKLAFVVGGISTILYTFIFLIIQMEDLALMFGSIGIFLVLAITMLASRKIDWFQVDQPEEKITLGKL